MIVVLLGYMGSGKSSVGKILACSKGYDFLDLDYYIEQQEQLSVADLFEKKDILSFENSKLKLYKKFVELTQILFSLLEEVRLVMVIQ